MTYDLTNTEMPVTLTSYSTSMLWIVRYRNTIDVFHALHQTRTFDLAACPKICRAQLLCPHRPGLKLRSIVACLSCATRACIRPLPSQTKLSATAPSRDRLLLMPCTGKICRYQYPCARKLPYTNKLVSHGTFMPACYHGTTNILIPAFLLCKIFLLVMSAAPATSFFLDPSVRSYMPCYLVYKF